MSVLIKKLLEDENVNLFSVNLVVVPEVPIFCLLQTEPKESENVEHTKQSGCLGCEAGQAMLLWEYF